MGLREERLLCSIQECCCELAWRGFLATWLRRNVTIGTLHATE